MQLPERPNRQEIFGSDMRKMDRIGMRLDKTIERVAKLEARLDLLDENDSGLLEKMMTGGKGAKKKR